MSTEAGSENQVLIVGAGPTGLVLALWLTRLGIAVRIIDRSPEPGTTSRALGVQARTLELYHQVDLDKAVLEGGVAVEALNLWVGTRQKARLPVHRMGEGLSPYPYIYMYAQDVHERMLIARLQELGVQVERPTELLRFEQDLEGVQAVLRKEDGREENWTGAYLAGCDGAGSTVRKALGIEFPGGTYAGRFYVADVEAEGPSVNNEIHLELEESEFLAIFPLKEEGHIRLIGAVSWEPEEDGVGLNFDDVSPRAMRNLKLSVNQVNWFSTYRVHHRVAERFRSGRVFLMGDAAHVHSPVGAQGMNTGLGDAINLGWKLAGVLKGEARAWVLDTYEPERIAFARRLVATTDRAFNLITRQGAVARFFRTQIAPRLLPALFSQAAVRRFLFRTISQVGIRYRHSALSEGAAGPVRAGDRLPWVPLVDADNFAPLTELAWQVHVYGEPIGGLPMACVELGLPLFQFAWRPEMRSAGLRPSACYLVRPDGYIGFVDPSGSPERLLSYWKRIGWVLRTRG